MQRLSKLAVLSTVIAAFLVAAVIAGVFGTQPSGLSAAGTPVGSAVTPPTIVTVDMEDIKFVPNEFTIPANTDAKVTFHNKGALPHNFSVTDHKNPNVKNLNISVTLQPGQSQTISINAPAGNYYFYCDEPGHEAAGMSGTMHVVSSAAAALTAPVAASPLTIPPATVPASSAAGESGTEPAEQTTPCSTAPTPQAAQAITLHGSGSIVSDVEYVAAPIYTMTLDMYGQSGELDVTAYDVDSGQILGVIDINMVAGGSAATQILQAGNAKRMILNIAAPSVSWLITLKPVQ